MSKDSLTQKDIEDITFYSSNKKSNDPQVIKKNILFVLRYTDEMIQKIENVKQGQLIATDFKIRMIKRLTVSRINMENYYHLNYSDQKLTEQHILLIRRITQNLGKILQLMQQYQPAKKVYKTIFYVESVCGIFKRQIELDPKNIKLRLDYAQYLSTHCRQNQAINILQQAYQLSKQMKQISKAKFQMFSIRQKMRDRSTVHQYQKSLFNDGYFVQFSGELEKQLDSIKQT